eukprot:365471-Chlamydomonas_euryale.AAC.17
MGLRSRCAETSFKAAALPTLQHNDAALLSMCSQGFRTVRQSSVKFAQSWACSSTRWTCLSWPRQMAR